jgi:sortase A
VVNHLGRTDSGDGSHEWRCGRLSVAARAYSALLTQFPRRQGPRWGGMVSRRVATWSVRGVVTATSQLIVTFGLVLLLFAAYEVWGKAAIVNAHQNDFDRQLAQQWGEPSNPVLNSGPAAASTAQPTAHPTAAPPGSVIGRLYIPRLKKHWVVVQGVDPQDIRYAPGHYPQSAMPGDIGNFAVAGHRSPAIFWDLDQLKRGDPIVVQTNATYFIYRVTILKIVKPTAIDEVAPVPGQPAEQPNATLLTLTTCNPRWDNDQRLIIHAMFDRSQPSSAGPPAELL